MSLGDFWHLGHRPVHPHLLCPIPDWECRSLKKGARRAMLSGFSLSQIIQLYSMDYGGLSHIFWSFLRELAVIRESKYFSYKNLHLSLSRPAVSHYCISRCSEGALGCSLQLDNSFITPRLLDRPLSLSLSIFPLNHSHKLSGVYCWFWAGGSPTRPWQFPAKPSLPVNHSPS